MSAAWWQRGVIYQIYPRSFQDSNGDGIGDLKGIERRLDYLADIGVDAIWISPIYPSPMVDFGYDVADYCSIDPRFGTLVDFDSLIASAHGRNLRVILDFVPNHSSDQHPWFVESRASRLVEVPLVTTIHGLSSERIVPVFKRYQDRSSYVSISAADRHPELRYAATIHHGIALDEFPFNPVGGEDLLFFGRIHPDKGAAEAIEAARRAGRRLMMAGIVQDRAYHERRVAPAIDGRRVLYNGPVGGDARARMLGSARALLHLINFDEPFGLSVIEAMACGTPAIACNRGSMPELIDHGVTGFLVESLDGAVEAIARIDEIDRAACRAAVATRFTVDHMADRYLSLYRALLG